MSPRAECRRHRHAFSYWIITVRNPDTSPSQNLSESKSMHSFIAYCEPHGPGLLGEPVNTLTNLVFIWAAVEAWNLAGRNRIRAWDLTLLICLLAEFESENPNV